MQNNQDITKSAPTDIKKLTLIGYGLIFVTFSIFIIWGMFSKLDSGAIASGEIIPSSKILTIQHKEGGVIKRINVKDGVVVEKDDILIELDAVGAQSELQIGLIDKRSLESLIERLEAEKNGDTSYNSKSIDSKNAQVQYQLFISRKEGLKKDIEILQKRIRQIEDEIVGHKAEINSLQFILKTAQETLDMNTKLYNERYIDKRKLIESQNDVAQIEGKIGKKYSEISQAKQKITETDIQIIRMKNQWKNNVLEQLKQAKDSLAVTIEKIKIAQDKLTRNNIVAPTSGKIHGLKFNTLGGVIKPGEDILQIVPKDQDLVVEAKLMPDDIDSVHIGSSAYVRLSAYLQRTHNAVKGEVTAISPNTFKDQQTGMSYYKVKITIDKTQLNGVSHMELQSGMLAQVEIVRGERTPLQYLIQPFVDSFHKSFKEE